jgi:hypothetical protein
MAGLTPDPEKTTLQPAALQNRGHDARGTPLYLSCRMLAGLYEIGSTYSQQFAGSEITDNSYPSNA